MKPFNVEKALRGEAIQTASGDKITGFTYIKDVTNVYCFIGVAEGVIYKFNKFGVCLESSNFDLFMSPKKIIVKGWVNVYVNYITGHYKTEKEAKENSNRIRNCLGQKFLSIEMDDNDD